MSRLLTLAGGVAAASLLAANPVAAQSAGGSANRGVVAVVPYIEASQVLDADLKGGDTVTYTSVAAGIDVAAATPRTNAQLSYRYDHRFSYDRYQGDDDVHTGLARVAAIVTPALTVEAGALATRTRSDIRGAAPGLLYGNDSNIAQLFSVYGGPSLSTTTGDIALNAAYQVGWTKVEAPSSPGLAPGQPRYDYFDRSLGQTAIASAGFAPNVYAPFGVTLSGGWVREDASQLDQRFEDIYGRADVLLPVSMNLALAGGVGYEKLTTSQRDPVVTAAGFPVIDSHGRYVTDESSPRRIAYQTDGVYFDAGVVWRPNHRTSVSAYVGRRYGTMRYTGTATYQASRSVGLYLDVYDSVETFGHQLREGLNNLPTSFVAARDAYSRQFNGCVFSTGGQSPGGCLNDVFQSITTASYRARGVDAVMSILRGRSTFGFGAGYANRKLYQPNNAPGVRLYGLEDESYYGQFFFNRQLNAVSGIDVNVFINYYDPASYTADGIWSQGATASYYRNFGRLQTTGSVGLYSFKVGDFSSDLSAQALLAARYVF